MGNFKPENQELRENMFQGTLDEIKPTLELEAYAHNAPALFLAHDQQRFSLVYQNKLSGCKPKRGFVALSTLPKDDKDQYPIQKKEYCNP